MVLLLQHHGGHRALRLLIAATSLATSLVACGSEPAHVGTTESAITNGATTTGDLGVVALVGGDALVCTATLIAPRVLLTAAHCVPDGAIPDAIFGGAVAGGTRMHVVKVKRHPSFDETKLTDDVAIALLDGDAPMGATPWPLPSTPLDIGSKLRLVGFGQTGATDVSPPQKRTGIATIASLTANELQLAPSPSQTCTGDSGGPAFATIGGVEVIVGITSSGDPQCAQMARDMRVDAYASFIAPWIAAAAAGSAGSGQRCYYAGNCAASAGACVVAIDDSSLSFCSPACGVGDSCESGLQCIAGSDGKKLCRQSVPSPGANGSACVATADCDVGNCVAPASGGTSVCAVTCFPDLPAFCTNEYACAPVAGSSDSACFAPQSIPKSGGGCGASRGNANGAGALVVALYAVFAGFARRRRAATMPRASNARSSCSSRPRRRASPIECMSGVEPERGRS